MNQRNSNKRAARTGIQNSNKKRGRGQKQIWITSLLCFLLNQIDCDSHLLAHAQIGIKAKSEVLKGVTIKM
jgi:hypothetical protein